MQEKEVERGGGEEMVRRATMVEGGQDLVRRCGYKQNQAAKPVVKPILACCSFKASFS